MKLLPLIFFSFYALVSSYAFAQNDSSEDIGPSSIAEYGLQETGNIRRCITYTKIDGLRQIASREFLFVVGETYYLNRTLNGCSYRPPHENKFGFVLETGNLCKNSTMYVNNKLCRLGSFKELEQISVEVGEDCS